MLKDKLKSKIKKCGAACIATCRDIRRLTKVMWFIAGVLAVLAVLAVATQRGREIVGISEKQYPIDVVAGDTLSGILSQHNVSGADINAIADILKKDCGVSSLRANSDKLIVSKPADDAPVSKIVLVSGPWKQVELTCGDDGKWTA
ncbi:MAG: hypothetical protein LBR41_02150, partial [Rickettsiales bacterium]|nr:hypothetical protein [Rickettsiales bacterium]